MKAHSAITQHVRMPVTVPESGLPAQHCQLRLFKPFLETIVRNADPEQPGFEPGSHRQDAGGLQSIGSHRVIHN